MGATNFYCTSVGPTPQEAFANAVKEAQWEHGHGGYTGTIAEKTSFTVVSDEPLTSENANNLANSLMDTDYADKWGPAGCIPLHPSTCQTGWSQSKNKPNSFKFLFFGWASS